MVSVRGEWDWDRLGAMLPKAKFRDDCLDTTSTEWCWNGHTNGVDDLVCGSVLAFMEASVPIAVRFRSRVMDDVLIRGNRLVVEYGLVATATKEHHRLEWIVTSRSDVLKSSALVGSILHLLSKYWRVVVNHIGRETNSIADGLAK
ncbi:hypothetical protein V6N11_050328 [Hibiscus sabdariffa]|uniref:RNase H type-1 domain-containing protein n=1 Tax=Hibiscus sabdariffa TaxID=183260 RepID=A0ABR2T9H7_9ROSI